MKWGNCERLSYISDNPKAGHKDKLYHCQLFHTHRLITFFICLAAGNINTPLIWQIFQTLFLSLVSVVPTRTCGSAWRCVTKRSSSDRPAEKEWCWASRSYWTWRSLVSSPALQRRWVKGIIMNPNAFLDTNVSLVSDWLLFMLLCPEVFSAQGVLNTSLKTKTKTCCHVQNSNIQTSYCAYRLTGNEAFDMEKFSLSDWRSGTSSLALPVSNQSYQTHLNMNPYAQQTVA